MIVGLAACRQVLGVDDIDTRGGQAPSGAAESASSSTSGGASGSGGTGGASSSSSTAMDCGDTLSSDVNCGACGHACAVGSCANGKCQPITIVNAQGTSGEYQDLIADPLATGHVYWAHYRGPGSIWRALKKQNASAQILAYGHGGQGWIYDLSTDGERLFFSDYSESYLTADRGFYAMNKNGTNEVHLGGSELSGPAAVRPVGSTLFFDTCFSSVGLGSLSLTGGPVAPIVSYVGAEPFAEQGRPFFTDGQWIYYSEASTGLNRIFADGEGHAVIYPGEVGGVMTVFGTTLLWAVDNKAIRRGSADGVAKVEDVAPITLLRGWFLRDSVLYFSKDNTIYRIALDVPNAPLETIVVGGDDDLVGSMAADAVSFYWIEFFSGRVLRQSF